MFNLLVLHQVYWIIRIDMEQVPEQTEAQFLVLYGEDKAKWSKTTSAAYEHLFKDKRRIVAANDNLVSEQSIYAFIKNNKLRHMEQANVLAKGEAYRDAALKC